MDTTSKIEEILNGEMYEAWGLNANEPEAYEQCLKRATQAIESLITEAKIEAYEHIRLSDNGMQEPLKSWLDGFIEKLKSQQEKEIV